jgi:hypothetical protein
VKDLRGWWPQGDGPAEIREDGTWALVVGYGQAQDVGEDFEVAAAVVDENTNRALLEWYARSRAANAYPSIPFPDTIDRCPPLRITVKKISH